MEIEERPPNIELIRACADLLRAAAEFPPCHELMPVRDAIGRFVIACCSPAFIVKGDAPQ